MRYFKWSAHVNSETWSVDEPQLPSHLNWWDFESGQAISEWPSSVIATYSEDLPPTDFPFVDFLIHIYSPHLRNVIEALGASNVQYLPLKLKGRTTGRLVQGYAIANYLQIVD